MSGDKTKKEKLQEQGRNVVTRTDSESRREEAKKKREKQKPEFNQIMVIDAQADNVSSREIFGKKLIPVSGYLKNMTAKIPEVPMPVTLHIISEYGEHKRRDSFTLEPGFTQLLERVDVKAGTLIKFSIEFEGEKDLDEIYLSGILAIK